MSVFSNFDDNKLPALSKTPIFERKMIDLLNDKLNKTLRLLHNPFIMRMMEYKIDISTVDNWIQAFLYVGLGVVEDD